MNCLCYCFVERIGKHASQAEGKGWKETTDIPSPFEKPPQKLLPEKRENGKGKGKGNGGCINEPAESQDRSILAYC